MTTKKQTAAPKFEIVFAHTGEGKDYRRCYEVYRNDKFISRYRELYAAKAAYPTATVLE